MGTILTLGSNLFHGIGSFFDWAKTKLALNNTPAQQSNSEAAELQKVRDQAAKDIANPDQTAARKDVQP